jgi:CheY-like chemotaxis protein
MSMQTGILLVDDDLEDQYILREAIESIKCSESLHTEENGLNALEYLNGLPAGQLPCLIMADLNMPKMDGADFLHHLKSSNHLKSIPVVIYSTSENMQDQEACIKRGALAYINKPLSYQQSIEVAKRVVEICSMGNV